MGRPRSGKARRDRLDASTGRGPDGPASGARSSIVGSGPPRRSRRAQPSCAEAPCARRDESEAFASRKQPVSVMDTERAAVVVMTTTTAALHGHDDHAPWVSTHTARARRSPYDTRTQTGMAGEAGEAGGAERPHVGAPKASVTSSCCPPSHSADRAP